MASEIFRDGWPDRWSDRPRTRQGSHLKISYLLLGFSLPRDQQITTICWNKLMVHLRPEFVSNTWIRPYCLNRSTTETCIKPLRYGPREVALMKNFEIFVKRANTVDRLCIYEEMWDDIVYASFVLPNLTFCGYCKKGANKGVFWVGRKVLKSSSKKSQAGSSSD